MAIRDTFYKLVNKKQLLCIFKTVEVFPFKDFTMKRKPNVSQEIHAASSLSHPIINEVIHAFFSESSKNK